MLALVSDIYGTGTNATTQPSVIAYGHIAIDDSDASSCY